MKNLFTYVPIVCLLMIIYFIDDASTRLILLVGMGVLAVFAKFKRSKLQEEDIVTDDRVNANISKWSLRIMFILNTLLIVILFIDNQGIFQLNFSMEMNLIIIGLIFVISGYFIGVKKLTWLLAGYNEKRVKDKKKLATLVGSTYAILGVGLLIFGFIGFKQVETIIMVAVGVILLEVVYVNAKMVQ